MIGSQFSSPSSLLDGSVSSRLGLAPAQVGRICKRVADASATALLILSLLPLLLLLYLSVKLASRGPAFFLHERIGHGGRMFSCTKLRTMVPDAVAVLERHLEKDEAPRLEWAASRKLKNDPRVTSLGIFLRRSSLDELPQLFNILLGDMSFVGPRPIVPNEVLHYGDQIAVYMSVRPGITGLRQISGRNDVVRGERVRLDVQYVRNWTFRRDVAILLATVPAVVLQRGSY